MKNFLNLCLLGLVIFIFVGCSPGLTVGSDKRIEADISDYKTFNWLSEVGEIPGDQLFIGTDGVLIFNNESTRKNIKDAIQTQLQAKGFAMNTDNPDMLVSFIVMEQDGELRTYTREGSTYLGSGPVERDVKMVNVEAGTILVNFIDADSGDQVWQGFASDGLEESDVEDANNLKSKVNAIFDEFDFSAFALN